MPSTSQMLLDSLRARKAGDPEAAICPDGVWTFGVGTPGIQRAWNQNPTPSGPSWTSFIYFHREAFGEIWYQARHAQRMLRLTGAAGATIDI